MNHKRTKFTLAISAIFSVVQFLSVSAAGSQNTMEVQFFEAFKTFCTPDPTNIETLRKRAIGNGWKETTASASPILVAKNRYFKAATQVLSLKITNRKIFMIHIQENIIFGQLTKVSSGTVFCQLYDFNAESPLSGTHIRKWLGVEPTRKLAGKGYSSESWFNPPKHDQFHKVLSEFYARTPISEKLGNFGVSLTISQKKRAP